MGYGTREEVNMHRKQLIVAAVTVISLGLAPIARAQEQADSAPHQIVLADPIRGAGHWGIGFGGGLWVSGISAKYFFSKGVAIQGVLGGFGWNRCYRAYCYGYGFGVDADLLFELPTIARAGDVMDLNWSAGPGVLLGIANPVAVGVNGEIGLEFDFIPVPIDIVVEYKPALMFGNGVPHGVWFDATGFGSHIRIYFQ